MINVSVICGVSV